MSNRTNKTILLTAIPTLVIMVGAGLGFIWKQNSKVFPDAITKQLEFNLQYPANKTYPINKQSINYDAKQGVVYYVVDVSGVDVSISEQPSPETFSDIPGYFDKFVEGLGLYTAFEVSLGKVHLTRPKDLKGKQAAVINTKGFLLFARPEEDLSESQWRQFFNSFTPT